MLLLCTTRDVVVTSSLRSAGCRKLKRGIIRRSDSNYTWYSKHAGSRFDEADSLRSREKLKQWVSMVMGGSASRNAVPCKRASSRDFERTEHEPRSPAGAQTALFTLRARSPTTCARFLRSPSVSYRCPTLYAGGTPDGQ